MTRTTFGGRPFRSNEMVYPRTTNRERGARQIARRQVRSDCEEPPTEGRPHAGSAGLNWYGEPARRVSFVPRSLRLTGPPRPLGVNREFLSSNSILS